MTGKYKLEINDKDFDKQVIQASKKTPIVVDFWAAWCGPCRYLGPTMEKLADDYKGKFILAKLNVDENHERAQEYRVLSIPSVKMFKNGKVIAEFVGAIPEAQVRKWLDSNL